MDKLFAKPSIIVADREYHPILFRYRNLNPTINIKVITKDDLLTMVSYSFLKDPIPFLLTKGYDFSNSKKILSIIRVAGKTQNPKIAKVFELLKDNDYLSEDEYGLYELKNKDIYLFEYEHDQELKNLLVNKGLFYKELNISDLSISYRIEYPNIVNVFPNKFYQYFYIYSDIRRRIMEAKNSNDSSKEEILKNKIKILIKDQSDIFYIDLMSNLFQIKSYYVINKSLINDEAISQKLKDIYQKKVNGELDVFSFSEEELENESLKLLKGLIDTYNINLLEDKDFSYANLLEIVSSKNQKETPNLGGISVTTKLDFDLDSLIYITNFQHGDFYKVYDDKNVISDEELSQIGVNPSYIKTELDRDKKLNYIRYNNVVLFSRVEQHLDDSIYDSQFFQEFFVRTPEGRKKSLIKNVKTGINKEGLYTQEAEKLYKADWYDKTFTKGSIVNDEYRTYDSSFKWNDKTINISEIDAAANWYITNLESYINCPFKYYLNKTIELKEGDYHSRAAGDFIHIVFADFSKKNYFIEKNGEKVINQTILDESIRKGKEAYKNMFEKNSAPYGEKEKTFERIIEYWLRKIAPVALDWYKEMGVVYQEDGIAPFLQYPDNSELPIKFTLTDPLNKNKYNFSGRIDKIMWTNGNDGPYYSIIDFKSGSETFTPNLLFFGKSVQLPLYYYAIENLSKNKEKYTNNGEFGGFYIQTVYKNSPKGLLGIDKDYLSKSKTIKSVFKAKGLFHNNLDYLKSVDPNIEISTSNGKPKTGTNMYIAGTSFEAFDSNENLSGQKDVKVYNFNDIIDDSVQAMVHIVRKILNKEFEVAPTSLDLKAKDRSRLSCKYCPYGDICYKKPFQVRTYEEDIKKHLLTKHRGGNASG